MNELKKVSIVYGATVVFSTAVGVGMTSLPIISTGMWFTLSVAVIFLTAFYLVSAGALLLEVNMKYPAGTGIHMMVHDLLGPKHAFLNDCMMLFNGFILLYAYLTVGSEAIQFYFNKVLSIDLNHSLAAICFAILFGVIFYLPPLIISRFLTVFIALMLLLFLCISYVLALNFDIKNAFTPAFASSGPESTSLFPYIFIALPYFMAAMGFQQTIPMLRELYNNDAKRVYKSILLGITIVSVLYLVWLFVIMGAQSQSYMITSLSSGESKLENIVSTLSENNKVQALMYFFIQVAIVTSFIGVAKGLLDYLKDLCVTHYNLQEIYPKLLVILLPLVLSIFFPYGFLIGIGFAGLAGAIWGGFYPALMAIKSREIIAGNAKDSTFETIGHSFTPKFTLFYSVLIVLVMILSLFNLLPNYPNL